MGCRPVAAYFDVDVLAVLSQESGESHYSAEKPLEFNWFSFKDEDPSRLIQQDEIFLSYSGPSFCFHFAPSCSRASERD